eukprot:CAMPEP_0171454194 /NCGR_PEP_ID=MMETSP0945-20130129/1583_1 /TAXON_ID=109269 /ORGANISM="Vaucheria litorea, Strain CCMP2940" /LENGTH=133 /DNA_ID=CAMNT_0011979179 /DNA_START=50 /DNA_END=448 /DNA_ORIENTATION=-
MSQPQIDAENENNSEIETHDEATKDNKVLKDVEVPKLEDKQAPKVSTAVDEKSSANDQSFEDSDEDEGEYKSNLADIYGNIDDDEEDADESYEEESDEIEGELEIEDEEVNDIVDDESDYDDDGSDKQEEIAS